MAGSVNEASWVVNSSNIFNNGGNLGIGSTTPPSAFTVGSGNKFQFNSQHLGKWAILFEVMREPRIGINIPNDGRPARSELHLYHTNFGGANDGVRIQNEGENAHF